jgi:antitoxin MazE
MTTTIQKWGNSLAVRLSKEVAESFSLDEGSVVSVVAKDNEIVIRRAENRKNVSLSELVKGITPKNIHKAVEWGAPRGKEVW